MKVLIAYASAHGSTAEVAHAMGRVLLERGAGVTVEDVKKLHQIGDYDAAILGSAVHGGNWLPEMTGFLRAAVEPLADKPVYFWINCIRVMERYGEQHALENYLNYDLLQPFKLRDKAVFAGKLDLANVDWDERWTLSARYDGSTWPSNFDGDFRDWNVIRAWAEKIADEIGVLQSPVKP